MGVRVGAYVEVGVVVKVVRVRGGALAEHLLDEVGDGGADNGVGVNERLN